MINTISILAVVLLAISSTALLVFSNWRTQILIIALQFLGAFWLTGLVWTIGLSSVKLVTGWMVCAILSASEPVQQNQAKLPEKLFRLVAAIVVLVFVYVISPYIQEFFNTGLVIIWGSLVLICSGLLHIGMDISISRNLIGLITFFTGFEIFYAAFEDSILVAGLIAAINMGFAFIATFMITKKQKELI